MVGLFSKPKRHLKNLVKEGDYKEALEFGKSLESKFSKDADYLFIMGSIYYILGDSKNSLHYIDNVLEIDKFDTEALLLKSNVHLYLEEYETAYDCCKKILEIDPENKEAKEIRDKLEED